VREFATGSTTSSRVMEPTQKYALHIFHVTSFLKVTQNEAVEAFDVKLTSKNVSAVVHAIALEKVCERRAIEELNCSTI